MILINVLVILALTSAIVFAMIRLSDVAIWRSQRFSDAVQGLALVAGGEASAIAVLRRDDPQVDHLREPWAQVGQQEVAIEGGRFALVVEDAQARFNLNSLPGSGALGLQVLDRIAKDLDLPGDVVPRIVARLSQGNPLQRLDDLVDQAGVSMAEVAALRAVVTVLPVATEMNINTMPQALRWPLLGTAYKILVMQAPWRPNGVRSNTHLTTIT